jgi:crotonobetainyl-CoA:carnitine CoA-transferase CaiB-like acyl-CoA transferase
MDILSAQSCLVGTMAALYARRSGQPAHAIATSLLGVATLSQGEVLLLADGSLSPTVHITQDQTGFGPYHRIFEASDGWIALAAKDAPSRAGVRAVLGEDEAGFERVAKSQSAAALIASLEAKGVACDHVVFEDAMNRFFDDPRNRELGLILALPQPVYGIVEQPGEFWNFVDTPMNVVRCCPALGEHTDEILREVGYSDAEISALREQKIVA